MLSRVLGFVRDLVCLSFFGSAVWDCFAIPFQVPNLFRRLFGEGALSAALIPIYSERLENNPDEAQSLARTVMTVVGLLLGGLTVVGWGVIGVMVLIWDGPESQLSAGLGAIMLPYMIFICLVAIASGILNVHGRFAAPAGAPLVLNMCMIVGTVVLARWYSDEPTEQIYMLAWAVLTAGVLQLGMQLWALRGTGVRMYPELTLSLPALKQVMVLMAPMVVGLSVMQINALMDSVIARALSATASSGESFVLWGRSIGYPVEEGAVTALYVAQRMYQLPLGVFGIAISTVAFPLLSAAAAKQNKRAFGEHLAQALRLVLFITVPCMVGMILLREPICGLFERGLFTHEDTLRAAWTLLFYAMGLTAYCLQHVVVRGFYAFQDSVTPVRLAVKMAGLNLVLNLVLIWWLGTGGLALSTAVCATIQVLILLWLLVKRYELEHVSRGVGVTAVKTVGATAVMSAAIWLMGKVSADWPMVWGLLATIAAAKVSFIATAWGLKIEELKTVLRR